LSEKIPEQESGGRLDFGDRNAQNSVIIIKDMFMQSSSRKSDDKAVSRYFFQSALITGVGTCNARSETAIESDIMENLSMKFGSRLKQQIKVPLTRRKTDSEFAATVLLRS